MKGMKEFLIAITMTTGLVIGGNAGADEITLDGLDQGIFYEPETISEHIALLPEEQDAIVELTPEVIVYSINYDMLAGQTLTEEEVLEALAGLSAGEHAVERALAVNIAGTKRINEVVFNALLDTDESVRNEAEFFSSKLLLSSSSF